MKISGVHHMFIVLLIGVGAVASNQYDAMAAESGLRVQEEESTLFDDLFSGPHRQLSAKCPKFAIKEGKKCICANGFVKSGSKCKCPKGKTQKEGKCSCPSEGQLYDSFKKKCTCIGGQYVNKRVNACICPLRVPFFNGVQCSNVPTPAASPAVLG